MELIKTAWWIRPKSDFGEVCPLYFRELDFDKEICAANLYITAAGVYEARIDGEMVGDFILAPGWTAYDRRHQYQCYDITNMLKSHCRLEVTVGRGWFRGPLVEYHLDNIWGGFSALIAALEVRFADGSQQVIVTDSSWSVCKSGILESTIYDGEVFDARICPENPETPEIFHASKASLIPQEGEIVREHEVISPVKMFTAPNGERIIDFGQNMTGYVELDVTAKDGERIAYSHAEILDADGNFYTASLRSAKQRIEYICRGGHQRYRPHHTFMGFRYIRIDSAPDGITADNFRAIVVHSDMKRTGHFACSNEKINKLFGNIIWGQRGNFLDVPTDCPQRDERLGWTGDAQVFIKTASYNFDVLRFFKKWLRDLAAEQYADGGVPIIIPNLLPASQPSAAWGDAAVICPWQLYMTYADKEVLREQLSSMIGWVEYMHSAGEEECLWLGGKHFGDWLGLDAEDGSFVGASRKDFIASAYFAYSTGLLVKALKALGMDAAKYEQLYENIIPAFRKAFPDCRTQTECAVALYFGLCENPAAVAADLDRMVRENGNRLTTGFVGTPYLLSALSDNGYAETAYSLLLQEAFPSWLYSVNMGATTIWEHWDGLREDGTMWSTAMNSFNHYAYGAVAAWMYETAAGIRLDENAPGFENVILAPVPDSRLDFAEASVETRHGTVFSRWEKVDGKIKYTFDVPNRATLILGGKTEELSRGHYDRIM